VCLSARGKLKVSNLVCIKFYDVCTFTRCYLFFSNTLVANFPALCAIVSTVYDTVFFEYTWSMTSCVEHDFNMHDEFDVIQYDGNNLICVYVLFFIICYPWIVLTYQIRLIYPHCVYIKRSTCSWYSWT